MLVNLKFNRLNIRQAIVYDAVRAGIAAVGWSNVSERVCDLIIRWGADTHIEHSKKPTLVMDFPYWNRMSKKNSKGGSYKISLAGIHPTEYLDRGFDIPGRHKETGGAAIKPWKKGGEYILVAGMGPKGSKIYGYRHGEWDKQAIETIKANSRLPIIYRAKPSDKLPPKIEGVTMDDVNLPISRLYEKAAAIVTHHGNTGVEALQEGIPIFCKDGPARLLGNSDLTKIEKPIYFNGREDFFEKLAYWQWSYDEIASGAPFRHLTKQGLI